MSPALQLLAPGSAGPAGTRGAAGTLHHEVHRLPLGLGPELLAPRADPRQRSPPAHDGRHVAWGAPRKAGWGGSRPAVWARLPGTRLGHPGWGGRGAAACLVAHFTLISFSLTLTAPLFQRSCVEHTPLVFTVSLLKTLEVSLQLLASAGLTVFCVRCFTVTRNFTGTPFQPWVA